MAQNENEQQSSFSRMASAAGAARSAVKAGKALASTAKGAAAGPYGVLAAGLWENRHTVAKITAALGTLLLIPVAYIMMLPSLVFGNGGLDDVPRDVLRDNNVIMGNISETESAIEEILQKKHNAVIKKIENEGSHLGRHCEYSITDEFADRIIYESTLIISQFCASTGNYKDINLKQLKKVLDTKTENIFSYTVSVTDREETDEKTKKTYTVHHYEYTVHYAGDSYYADNVFELDETKKTLASEYAKNLHLFLFDTVYQVKFNPDLQPGETGSAAVELALTKLGTPYSQEYRSQEGYFDCSSFTYWVYDQLGVNLSYGGANTAAAQGRFIMENDLAVAYEDLAPGDLVFYSFKVNNRFLNIDHVAIYAGDGYVVDASFSKKNVVHRQIYNTGNIVLCGRPYKN